MIEIIKYTWYAYLIYNMQVKYKTQLENLIIPTTNS